MASGVELDRFLGELSSRRERVLRLAEPSGPSAPDLLAELRELGEQLVVADEELRVQQEELDEAHEVLTALGAERDDLLEHSARAYVVTDEHGLVLQTTRAVQQLARQPWARVVPRPIATWFAVADRRTVRNMLARGPGRAESLRLQPDDGDPVEVDVVVSGVVGALDGAPGRHGLLRWELLPTAAGLHVVPVPVPDPEAGALERALAQVEQLQRAVGARQLVGQAVGILVERHRIAADEAFDLLVRESQERHVKLRTVADTLVETGQGPRPRPRP